MNRILLNELNNNGLIEFVERPGIKFEIKSLIGKGASCVVYHAIASDNTEHLLKEYYPKNLELSRNDDGRIVVPEKEAIAFEQGLLRFQKGAEQQKVIRLSNESLKNFTCNVQGYYQANGTEYIDMTCFNGNTYDKVQEESLFNLVLRMKTLTQVVGNYHKAGLLHLDIKPENIYVRPANETVEDVMLFDFDSVTAMQDIVASKALSCTKSWAASEQLLPAKRKSICPATDLFAIGEIIFAQIFGRHSTNAERRTFVTKYNYDYDATIFKNVNPKVFSILDDLLSHTICGVVEKRYQTADELVEKLEELIKIANPKEPYLKSSLPAVQNFFIGRDDEIKRIHQMLNVNNILFLNGIGGIGKSELAKNYALQYKDEYDAIIFAPYVSDVNMLLQDDNTIPLFNFAQYPEEKPEEYCTRKLRKLQELCDARTLFIVDNLDREDDADLNKLLNLGCKLLVTTRMDFSEYGYGQVLNLDVLSERKKIRDIFDEYYTKELNQEEQECVEEIIDFVAGHTMTVELLAKQMMAGRVKPNKMLAKLQEGGISESGKEKVRVGKDGILSAQSAYAHIQTLFDLSELEEKGKYVLANLSLIPYTGISTELFYDWCKLEDYEAINRLVVEGWIRLDGDKDYISLHPVIRDVVVNILTNTYISVDDFVQNALEYCDDISLELQVVYSEIITQLLKMNYVSNCTGDFLSNVPISLWKYGNRNLMVDSIEKALLIRSKLYGSNHKKVADTLHSQGILYREFGDLIVAEEKYKAAIEILINLEDDVTEELAQLYNDLGSLYGDMDECAKCESYYKKALYTFEKCTSDVRKYIASVHSNLGAYYIGVNNFIKAKEALNISLDMSKQLYGDTNNEIAVVYNNIGGLHLECGEYEVAKEYFLRALDIRMGIFGECHADTLITMNNIGSIFYHLGNYDDAETSWKKSLNITIELYGEDDIRNALLYNNLGTVYLKKYMYLEAEIAFKKSLKIFYLMYGRYNGSVPTILMNLGNLYAECHKLKKSDKCHRIAFKIYKAIFDTPHTSIARSLYNIGCLRIKQNNIDDAKKLLEEALEMYTEIYGESHPDIIKTKIKLSELN